MTKTISFALAFMAACGQVLDHPIDGASSPDDAAPGGASPNVTVTVVESLGISTVAGASVVFVARDGRLIANLVTDADGKARTNIMPGASVTLVSSNRRLIQTVFGLQPGDDLTLGQTFVDMTPVGTFQVSFTPAPGNGYTVLGGCGGATPTGNTATLTIRRYCQTPMLEIAVVGTNELIAIDKLGVPYTDGGTVDVGGSFAPGIRLEEDYTNIPPSVSQIGITRNSVGLTTFGVKTAPTTTTLALTIRGMQSSIALVQSQLFHASGAQQLVQRAILGTAVSDTFDVGATMLAWLGKPTFDATTQTIHTPIEPSGGANPAPDLFVTNLFYTREVNGLPTSFEWQTFSATPGDVDLPPLPIELGDLNLKPTDAVTTLTGEAFDFDGYASYAAVREHAMGLVITQPRNPALSYRHSQSP